MPLLLLVLTLLLPAGLYAQDDQRAMNDCTKKAADHAHAVDCAAALRDKLQKNLDEVYAKRMQEAKQTDADMKQAGSLAFGNGEMEQALAQSQQAFGKYMEAECGRQMGLAMGGTFGADMITGCEINLIRERISALNGFVDH